MFEKKLPSLPGVLMFTGTLLCIRWTVAIKLLKLYRKVFSNYDALNFAIKNVSIFSLQT